MERQLQYDLEESRFGYEDCVAAVSLQGVPSVRNALQAFKMSGTICSMTYRKILINNAMRNQLLHLWILILL